MRKIFFTLALFALVLSFTLDSAAHHDAVQDKQEIEKVIKDAYIDGIQNNRDIPAIRKGFHPDFVMLYLREGKLTKMTLEQWIERIERSKAKQGETPRAKTTHKIRQIDVEGHSAVASLDVFREGKHLYTDHMALYHFEDGWKIVNKIFYSHQ